MKRVEALATSCLVAGVLVAGCSANQSPGATVQPVATTEQPALPQINLDVLPATLPESVTKAAATMVKLVNYGQPTKIDKNTISYNSPSFIASGERVGPNLYLTAGHLIRAKQNAPSPGLENCHTLNVKVPTNQAFAEASEHRQIYGTTLNAQKEVGTYMDGDVTAIPDIALVQANPGDLVVPHATIPLASEAMHIGQAVFSLGYQPDTAGKLRSPDQGDISASDIQAGYDKPAIFGGVIVSFQSNGNPIVAEGLKSYGAVTDDQARGGKSGGALVNTSGQLLAISVEANSIPRTAAEVGDLYSFTPGGILPKAPLSFEIAQPVTRPLIDSLTQQISAAATCTY